VNGAVTLVTVVVVYVIVSVAMFRFSPEVSPNIVRSLPVSLRVLAQSSKADRVPEDYIAILGDSYAEGLGDWLASVGTVRGASYSAAHVLHDRSGRDVVSFGHSGASSAEAMVRMPTRALGSGGCARLTGIPDPVEAYIYFYEGNDLSDNVGLVRSVGLTLDQPDLRLRIDEYLRQEYGQISGLHCINDLAHAIGALSQIAFATLFSRPEELAPREANGSEVLIGGMPTRISTGIQIPPALLSPRELAVGLEIYDLSLAWLRERLPATRLTVVYLPSPSTSYRFIGEEIKLRYRGEEVMVPTRDVFAASDATCTSIRDLTIANGVRFIDARPAIRAAAGEAAIHGPADWLHFNEIGYTALGDFLFRRLADSESDLDCTTPPDAAMAQPGSVLTSTP
jgi:hypothetical protein